MSRVKRKKHGSKPSTLLAAEKEDSALKIQETEVKNQEMGGRGLSVYWIWEKEWEFQKQSISQRDNNETQAFMSVMITRESNRAALADGGRNVPYWGRCRM